MSEIKRKFFGRIKNGVKHYYKPIEYQNLINSLENKEFEETISERFVQTTTDQHAFYRGAIIKTCLETELFGGWTDDEIHDYFRGLYLSRTLLFTFPNGKREEIKVLESTASISKKKMAQFIDSVINWLAQQNIYIQSPEEYVLTKYSTKKARINLPNKK